MSSLTGCKITGNTDRETTQGMGQVKLGEILDFLWNYNKAK